MDFILYTPKRAGGKTNTIKIDKQGNTIFNTGFLQENELVGKNYVQFLYNRENKEVAYNFCGIKVENTFKLGKTTHSVNTATAFKICGIKPTQGSHEFKKVEDKNQILFIIKL